MRKFPQLLGTLRKFPRCLGIKLFILQVRIFPQLLGTLRKFPRWMGQVAAHIASEDISTVAGNTEEISSVDGAGCCTYCK